MKTIDTHSHFNLHQFEHDLPESIARMAEAEVGTICIGIDLPTSDHAMRLAQEHKSIWGCVGQHPTEWDKDFDENEFRKLAQEPKVVAIGECGLDYYRLPAQAGEKEIIIQKQKELFLKQIYLARELNLPLMLHIRPEPARPQDGSGAGGEGTMTAYEEALDILEEYKNEWADMRGTAHFFVGTKAIAQRFLDLGFYISFSGVITFVKEYAELVDFVPLDRILPETDAPFATPAPYRGTRNQPEYVLEVIKKVAEIKGISFEWAQEKLLSNSKALFSI